MKPRTQQLLTLGGALIAVFAWFLISDFPSRATPSPFSEHARVIQAREETGKSARRHETQVPTPPGTPSHTETHRTADAAIPSQLRHSSQAEDSDEQARILREYSTDQLEEAGVTRVALYSSRAHLHWLSIGSTLHHAGHSLLASEVQKFILLALQEGMKPYPQIALNDLLATERRILMKLQRTAPLGIPVRGSLHPSLGKAIQQVDINNEAASNGGGPSMVSKVKEAEAEVQARQLLEQFDRKPGRGWSSDPVERSEEISDRRLPRPIAEQEDSRGLEEPARTAQNQLPDAGAPEL